jgi:hypothetical protein
MWKEVVTAYFKVPSRQSPGGKPSDNRLPTPRFEMGTSRKQVRSAAVWADMLDPLNVADQVSHVYKTADIITSPLIVQVLRADKSCVEPGTFIFSQFCSTTMDGSKGKFSQLCYRIITAGSLSTPFSATASAVRWSNSELFADDYALDVRRTTAHTPTAHPLPSPPLSDIKGLFH